MMTVKRQKQKSSVSSSVGHSNRGKIPLSVLRTERGPSGDRADAVGCFCEILFVRDRLVPVCHGLPHDRVTRGLAGQSGGDEVSCTGWKS